MMEWRLSAQGTLGKFETLTSAAEAKHEVQELWFVAQYPGEERYFVSPGWVCATNRRHDIGPFDTREEAIAVAELFLYTGFTGKEGK